jgi:hypothetical protein
MIPAGSSVGKEKSKIAGITARPVVEGQLGMWKREVFTMSESMMRTAKRLGRWGHLVLAWCLIAGCASNKDPGEDANRVPPPIALSTNFDENKTLFSSIGKSGRITLYEGLPHQAAESELVAEEKRKKDTVTLHGFSFYRELLELQPNDLDALKALVGTERSFHKWGGEKKCGGFHPDYCVEWAIGTDLYRMLICFGCHEVKLYGPEGGLYCDIGKQAYEQLVKVLTKYQKNRPPRPKEEGAMQQNPGASVDSFIG